MFDVQLIASGFVGGAVALVSYSIGVLIGDYCKRKRNKGMPID